jgi:hypothetical protein
MSDHTFPWAAAPLRFSVGRFPLRHFSPWMCPIVTTAISAAGDALQPQRDPLKCMSTCSPAGSTSTCSSTSKHIVLCVGSSADCDHHAGPAAGVPQRSWAQAAMPAVVSTTVCKAWMGAFKGSGRTESHALAEHSAPCLAVRGTILRSQGKLQTCRALGCLPLCPAAAEPLQPLHYLSA